MNQQQKNKEDLREELMDEIESLGFPREFGLALSVSLGTEMTMRRMIGYLKAAQPMNPEEIADEMLAIISDRDKWQEKKINEHYNQKLNYFLNVGVEPDEE